MDIRPVTDNGREEACDINTASYSHIAINPLSMQSFALTRMKAAEDNPRMRLLSTAEAASKLGVTVARVQQLIWDERLPAQRVGRTYVIRVEDLKLVEDRPAGRPPRKAVKRATAKKGGKK